MRLSGKVALVSGAASGIGAAIARRFVQEGAAVTIGDIQGELGGALADELAAAHEGRCRFEALDVTRAADWQRAVAATVAAFGHLDILVNDAGVGIPRRPDARPYSIEELPEEVWDRVMSINAKSVFLGTKHVIAPMRAAGGGSIVNISSVAGIVGTASTVYGTSKGAIRLFTKSAAVELAPEHIRCNSVHPGTVVTPQTATLRGNAEIARRHLEASLLHRFAEPEEIAAGVLYLASDEAAFVTGTELVIDGGRIAQ